jgi:hypothetical protein
VNTGCELQGYRLVIADVIVAMPDTSTIGPGFDGCTAFCRAAPSGRDRIERPAQSIGDVQLGCTVQTRMLQHTIDTAHGGFRRRHFRSEVVERTCRRNALHAFVCEQPGDDVEIVRALGQYERR